MAARKERRARNGSGAEPGSTGHEAGGSDAGDYGRCGPLWPNGSTVMFQFLIADFDQDVPC